MKIPSKKRFPLGAWIFAPLLVIPLLLLVPTPKQSSRTKAFETIAATHSKLSPEWSQNFGQISPICIAGRAEKDYIVIFPKYDPPRNIAYYESSNLASKFGYYEGKKIGIWFVPIWNPESPKSNQAYQLALGSQTIQEARSYLARVISMPVKGKTSNNNDKYLDQMIKSLSATEVNQRTEKLQKNYKDCKSFSGYGIAMIQGTYYQLNSESETNTLISQYPD